MYGIERKRMRKFYFCLSLILIIFPLKASEKSVYLLLHGLYSSSYHWDKLIHSEGFQKGGFTYGGNFYISNKLLSADYVVTPDLEDELSILLQNDKCVFTLDFASGFQSDFQEQAKQIKDVLQEFPQTAIDFYLVGHSMGGLAARCYLTSQPQVPVKGLITIGTPNLGSYLGNTDERLTSLIGVLIGSLKRPDNLITGMSRVWKEKLRNVTPALAPNSKELQLLNQRPFPEDVKVVSLFSAINTPAEINALSEDEKFVYQVLQVEKLKSFQATSPKDMEITRLYNDLYYNDGMVSICSQNINNAIPNKYSVNTHHIPTRLFHDSEPEDVAHLLPAMQIIKQKTKPIKHNIFIYSTTPDVIIRPDYYSIQTSFLRSDCYDATIVVQDKDNLNLIRVSNIKSLYDYSIFIINDSQKLHEINSRLDKVATKSILVDFSVNNNIKYFQDKEILYIKIVTVEEAENFFKFVSDMLSGKVHVQESELETVKEQIIRYYFPSSNMTERLQIPHYWWLDNLSFFQ